MIVMAFQESVVWGLVYLFLPFGALAFMLTRWDRTWRPFVLNLNALIGAIFFLLAPAFFVKRVDPTEVGSTMVSFFELLIT